ncbi:MAG TPA: type I glyceraldehyde-3-phosphate dehydrogenase [Synergistales bacterium]|nr:type I glyceraldehyde-3-phosphate dehydrogenase [Synergistales bacterium]HRV96949.1 type I glyceraldehyde-3-phosphate dehydrogenase [Aminobacteriaceae bacterium]
MKKIAINGLGRIGRLVLRCYMANKPADVEIVALNDLTPASEMAYLIKFDSIHRKANFSVEARENSLVLDGKEIPLFKEKDPAKLPWKELGVDIVLECTGFFTKREKAMAHIEAGAKRVIISAPAEDSDLTIVLGVNENMYDPAKHVVVSNASCTTNSLAPVTKILNDAFGIEYLMGTTIHAYTSTQVLVDVPKGGGRKGRAAAVSLVPATTGAAKAMVPLFPELKGKMDMISVRVPVADGSLTDIVVHFKKEVTVESVNAALKSAADGKLKGIVEYNDEEIVSADIIGNTHSGIVDAPSTKVIMGKVAKVMVWYDNEYGYSNRMVELAQYIAGKE